MELKITIQDPLGILASTKQLMENSRFVSINPDKIPALAERIAQQINQGTEKLPNLGNMAKDLQFNFINSAVNFCFWPEKGKEKWRVGQSQGGNDSLVACLAKAVKQGKNILQAEYLARLSLSQTAEIFQGEKQTQIPLLEQRRENLNQAGKILLKKYQGEFINLLQASNFDAIKLTKLIYTDFPSFRDIFEMDGQKIYFLKRAQLCSLGLLILQKRYPRLVKIKNLNLLTAMADYKLPQILRNFGIISYANQLASQVDNGQLIPSGSRQELEIRGATIWGIELIRQKMPRYSAAQIDHAVWLISQRQTGLKPYHRTRTIYY